MLPSASQHVDCYLISVVKSTVAEIKCRQVKMKPLKPLVAGVPPRTGGKGSWTPFFGVTCSVSARACPGRHSDGDGLWGGWRPVTVCHPLPSSLVFPPFSPDSPKPEDSHAQFNLYLWSDFFDHLELSAP